jgi:hypothetical protein
MDKMDQPRRIRHVFQVRLTPRTNRELDRVVVETCMTKATIVSRVLKWFWRQDHALRSIILGITPAADAPRVAAESLAQGPTANPQNTPSGPGSF